jgi:predicted DNA-binding ribbon-helix-helix protein
MSTGLVKHSVRIAGHPTSVSLEPEFWDALQELAAANGRSVNAEIAAIDQARGARNLSSAIRLAILADLRAKVDISIKPVTD